MFVEGLYLYILVVKTFSIELINIHNYFLIGYGLPAIIVLVWSPIKFFFGTTGDGVVSSSCTFQTRDIFDIIFICPMLVVILANIFFLAKIMFVLITKLRAATTAESQQYRCVNIVHTNHLKCHTRVLAIFDKSCVFSSLWRIFLANQIGSDVLLQSLVSFESDQNLQLFFQRKSSHDYSRRQSRT